MNNHSNRRLVFFRPRNFIPGSSKIHNGPDLQIYMTSNKDRLCLNLKEF